MPVFIFACLYDPLTDKKNKGVAALIFPMITEQFGKYPQPENSLPGPRGKPTDREGYGGSNTGGNN
jgi:hypothetical protein